MDLVGIHQPNLFPWLGYFHRVATSKRFIFFDHVQKPGGRSWMSRVKVTRCGEVVWLSVPILKKGRSKEKISEVEFGLDSASVMELILSKLSNYYKTAPFKRDTLVFLENNFTDTKSVAKFNMDLIKAISKKLELQTVFQCSSEKFEGKNSIFGSEMILETCQRFNVKTFHSGLYAYDNLIDHDSFKTANIKVKRQKFSHPYYCINSKEGFVEGLSILDYLMLEGFDKAIDLFKDPNFIN